MVKLIFLFMIFGLPPTLGSDIYRGFGKLVVVFCDFSTISYSFFKITYFLRLPLIVFTTFPAYFRVYSLLSIKFIHDSAETCFTCIGAPLSYISNFVEMPSRAANDLPYCVLDI